MNADGSGAAPVSFNSGVWDADASWSPAGDRIAFASNRNGGEFHIFVHTVASPGSAMELTFSGSAGWPSWAPNGQSIVYAADGDIFRLPADGTGSPNPLTSDGAGNDDSFPSFSPDGLQIAFVSNRTDDADIWVMNGLGTDERRVLHLTGTDGAPQWAPVPGNDTLLFHDGTGGFANLATVKLDGSGFTRLTNLPSQNAQPHWVRNLQITADVSQINASPRSIPTADIPQQMLSPHVVETAGILQLPLLRSPIFDLLLLRSGILQLPLLRSPALALPNLTGILQLPLLRSPALGMRSLLPADLGNQPAVKAGLGRILLSNLPIKSGAGWKERLVGTGLEVRPLQDITFGDVLAAGLPDEGLPTLEQLDLTAGAFGRLSTFALMMGDTRLSAYNGIDWCGQLAAQNVVCADVGGTNSTLVALEIAGVNPDRIAGLAAIKMADVTLPGADRAALAEVLLDSIDLERASVGGIKLSEIPDGTRGQIVNCTMVDCASDTHLADAFDPAHAILPTATIGILKPAIGHLSVQEVVLGSYSSDAEDSYDVAPKELGVLGYGGTGSNAFGYKVSYTPVANNNPADAVTVVLPEDFRYVPNSTMATVTGVGSIPLPEPSVDDNTITWDSGITIPPGAKLDLQFQARPGLELATKTASVTVVSDNVNQGAGNEAPVTVNANFETGDNLGSATAVAADTLNYGYMDHVGDVDYFTIQVPQPGSRISVSLNQCECDADLMLFHPASARGHEPLRPAAASAPIQALGDQAVGLNRLGEPLVPETLNDIPIADLPVAATSGNRGNEPEVVQAVAWDAAVPSYTIQVSSYNRSTSTKPYAMRVTVSPPPHQPPVGLPRAFPEDANDHPTNPGTPDIEPGTETLILADSNRMRRAYGDGPAVAAMDALRDLALSPAVKGVVVDVSSLDDVETAQAIADGEPSDPESANDVIRAINAGIDDLFTVAERAQLKFMVIAGTDEILPMARIPDLTQAASERGFAQELRSLAATTGGNNALLGAAAAGMILTDDPYGSFRPTPWLGTFLYTPDVAIGRLVETPADIVAAVDRFLHPANTADPAGTLRPTTHVTAGYDFMTKMAQAIKTSLDAQLGGAQPASLVNETWEKGAFDTAVTNAVPVPGVIAANAHMDPTTLQPPNVSQGMVKASSLANADLTRRILFTMGCHSGFSITNFLAATGVDSKDWPEAAADAAAFVGNTGFGVGVRDTIAFSARLFADFADNLGSMSLGQALMQAKQQYIAGGPPNVYDYKIVAQATYFGLPGFRVASSVAPPPPPTPRALSTDPITGLEIASVNVNNPVGNPSGPWHPINNGEGTYYELDGGDLMIAPNRPIQPKLSLDVTQPGKDAAGALIVGATSFDDASFNPALARPMLDTRANEPELQFSDVIFPSALQAVTSWRALDGPRQNLVLVPAQFHSTNTDGVTLGIERRFSKLDTLVYYRPPGNTDHDPLVYRSIEAGKDGGNVHFKVQITDSDGSTAERVIVLHHVPGTADWVRDELVLGADGFWTASAPITGTQIEYFVQAVKDNGQVFNSTNKGDLFDSVASPAPPGAITGTINGTPTNGWYTDPTSVSFDGGPGVTFAVTIDGTPVAGTFIGGQAIPVTGDGRHEVAYLASDGRTGSISVAIDHHGPAIVASVTPAANTDNWRKSPVTVHFECTDTGSGVATCPVDQTLNHGAGQTVNGTATDAFGNSTVVTISDLDVDGVAPTIEGEATAAPNGAGWYNDDVTVTFTCSDGDSGLDGSCPGAATVAGEGDNLSVTRSVNDKAGNTGTTTFGPVKIDRTAPTVTGTPPEPNANGWFNADVTVTPQCTDPLSGVASCTPGTTSGEGTGKFATAHAIDNAGNGGSATFGAFNVDKTKPVVTGAPTTAPNVHDWYSGPVTVHFTCTDALSGVAAPDCPADVVLSDEGANQSVTRTATDRAGNTQDATVSGINIDRSPPSVDVIGDLLGLLIIRTTSYLPGTAVDSLSGVASVSVTYSNVLLGGTSTVAASVGCNATRTSCSWTAPAPPLGVYSTTVRVTDRVGHTNSVTILLYVSLRL